MEPDRFKQNHTAYVVGLVCLILSLSSFAFAIYILPYLSFGFIYQIPGFVLNWQVSLQKIYGISSGKAGFYVFLIFFVPGLITALIAYFSSNLIDDNILQIKKSRPESTAKKTGETKEAASLITKLIIIVVLVLIAYGIIQWLLYVPNVQNFE